jgi:transcriptional regulator GlxA family with amidase domain
MQAMLRFASMHGRTQLPQIRPPMSRTQSTSKARRARSSERVVVLFAYDGCQSLDVTGPLEVFNAVNRHGTEGHRYRVVIASRSGGTIRANSGLQIAGTTAIDSLPPDLDTVLLVGGNEEGLRAAAADPATLAWIRSSAQRARRFGSVCTGAFLLGAAGLLKGRRATTHWNSCVALAALFPDAEIVPDAIYVADGPLYTSAGITAAMDLALALVEADLGRRSALAAARHLVLFLRRPGGQSQFSSTLSAQARATHPLRELLTWIVEHPGADLTLGALAQRAHMSERNFTRRFRIETGVTPAQFIESARLDRARALLEETDWTMKKLARQAGFGSVDALQRAFVRRLSTTPREYRQRFSGC